VALLLDVYIEHIIGFFKLNMLQLVFFLFASGCWTLGLSFVEKVVVAVPHTKARHCLIGPIGATHLQATSWRVVALPGTGG
jgi:hypothetical protein